MESKKMMRKLVVNVTYSIANEAFEVEFPDGFDTTDEDAAEEYVKDVNQRRDLDVLNSIGMFNEFDDITSITVSVDDGDEEDVTDDCEWDTDDELLYERDGYCVVEAQEDIVMSYTFEFAPPVEFNLKRLSVYGIATGPKYYIGMPEDYEDDDDLCPGNFDENDPDLIKPTDFDLVAGGAGISRTIYNDGDLVDEIRF